MTTLLVDEFQGNFYLFSDGVVTQGCNIISREYVKSVELPDGRIVAFCGIVGSLSIAVELVATGKMHESSYNLFQGNCTVLILNDVFLEMHDIYNHEKDGVRANTGYSGIYTKDSFPLFYGSGRDHMTGAYFALLKDKPETEHEYLELVERAFKAHAERITNAGELLTTRKIVRKQ